MMTDTQAETPVEQTKTEEKENTNVNGNESVSSVDLDEKIIRQIEYYFGDINLPRDKFLQEEIKKDDGWVPLETMLLFKRLAKLTTDFKVIVEALKKSSKQLVEISDDSLKIRRSQNKPLPELCEDRRKELVTRSIYCKGFPTTDITLNDLLDYFEPFGPLDNLIMRNYLDKAEKKWKFKGSVFAIFPTKEKASEFLALESVKYKDTELIRKWQSIHIEEKKKERESRSKKSAEEVILKKMKEKEDIKPVDLPKGAFLRLKGCTNNIKREEMKEVLEEKGASVAFVEYNVGDPLAIVRLHEEGMAKKVLEAFEGNIVEVKGVKLEAEVIEGEEEENLISKSTADLLKRRELQSNKKQKGRKQGRGNQRKHGYKGYKKRRGNRDDEDEDDMEEDADSGEKSNKNSQGQKRKNEDPKNDEAPAKKEKVD